MDYTPKPEECFKITEDGGVYSWEVRVGFEISLTDVSTSLLITYLCRISRRLATASITSSCTVLYAKASSSSWYIYFLIHWIFPDICDVHAKVINSSYGALMSPNYPEAYPMNEYCKVTIKSMEISGFIISFKDLSIGTSGYVKSYEIKSSLKNVGLWAPHYSSLKLEPLNGL